MHYGLKFLCMTDISIYASWRKPARVWSEIDDIDTARLICDVFIECVTLAISHLIDSVVCHLFTLNKDSNASISPVRSMSYSVYVHAQSSFEGYYDFPKVRRSDPGGNGWVAPIWDKKSSSVHN